MHISKVLDTNIKAFDQLFTDCGDIVKRKISIGKNADIKIFVAYIDMLVNTTSINENIMYRLMLEIRQTQPQTMFELGDVMEALMNSGITSLDIKEVETLDDISLAVMTGDTVVFVEGSEKALVVSTKGYPNRGVPSAETEVNMRGAKDAFSEVFRINTMLIRRRIRDTRLKVEQLKLGRRSSTDVALMYLSDVVRPEILKDLRQRIKRIDIDAILESGYVEQLVDNDWVSPFPQLQTTERPDKAAASILEGRIVIVIDNTPFVLIAPTTFNALFQSPDDYYQRFEISSFLRMLRFLAGFLALTIPGLYIATVVFHPSMLPMRLAFKLAGARESVPFPVVIEVLIMDIAFELLREAGVRLPAPIGGTIGIVGGIIIGQAAVEAGLVSPIVVIIVAMTGICSFVLPNVSLVNAFRLLKYLIILISAMLGFFGFWIAILLIAIHLCSLKSFSIPYLYPFVSGNVNESTDVKDSIVRLPISLMQRRPIFSRPDAEIRQAKSVSKKRKVK